MNPKVNNRLVYNIKLEDLHKIINNFNPEVKITHDNKPIVSTLNFMDLVDNIKVNGTEIYNYNKKN